VGEATVIEVTDGKFDYADSIGERWSGDKRMVSTGVVWPANVASGMSPKPENPPSSPACLAHEAPDSYHGLRDSRGNFRISEGPRRR